MFPFHTSFCFCSNTLECLPFDTLPEKKKLCPYRKTQIQFSSNVKSPESQVYRGSPLLLLWEVAVSPIVCLASCIPKSFSRTGPHRRRINIYEHRIRSIWVWNDIFCWQFLNNLFFSFVAKRVNEVIVGNDQLMEIWVLSKSDTFLLATRTTDVVCATCLTLYLFPNKEGLPKACWRLME